MGDRVFANRAGAVVRMVDRSMTDEHTTRVTRFLKSMRNSNTTDDDREQLPDRDDRADWNADNSGVHSAKLRYEGDIQNLEYEFDDVKLEIGNDDSGEVSIIAEEESAHWRSVVIRFDGETAEEVSEQLELAAKMVRKGQGADIRT